MRSITIALDGVEVHAVLNVRNCPSLCAAFLQVLPHADRAIHETRSGDAIGTLNPFPIPSDVWKSIVHPFPGIEDCTFKAILNPGDVVYYPGGGVNKLVISYGDGLFSDGPAGVAYVNHLATIEPTDPNFDRFMTMASETHDRGSKSISFRRG